MSEDDVPGADDEPENDDGSVNSDDGSATDETTPLSGLRDRVEGRSGRRNGEGRAATGEAGSSAEGAPLSDLAGDVRSSGDAEGDPFESVEVGDVDGAALWDAVVDEEAPPDPAPESEAEPVADDPEGDEHVVDKREFCQRCEYFAAPPDVACTHGGTEILELVDADRFRVRNCPKVEADDDEFGPGLPDE